MSVQTNQSTEQQSTEQIATLYSYLTVDQFCEKHRAFKIGGLRSQIFNEDKNGLKESGAIVRNGRKILVNEPKYFAWLEAKNQSAACSWKS